MKRTKEWWSRLNRQERSELVYLEKNSKSTRSSYIPDDCSECGACSTPHLGYGLCTFCLNKLTYLIRKGNNEGL